MYFFVVHNIDGRWLYWGTIKILSITHDCQKQSTSGFFEVKEIYSPQQMKQAYDLIDADGNKSFLS